LLTPMDLARPSLWHSSMAAHTDLKSIGIRSSSSQDSRPGPRTDWPVDQIQVYVFQLKTPAQIGHLQHYLL
jgi:hypothetical protein